MDKPESNLKSLKWKSEEVFIVCVMAILISLVSWQFALGMLFVEFVGYFDHKCGKETF